jgi:hypothetical protein
MRCLVGAAIVTSLCLLDGAAGIGPAAAEVVIAVDKSKQRMTVLVDGAERYVWKVSTGTGGAPKSGTYHPQRLEKKWFSHKFGMSPMPHSIFFDEGFAIHGTVYVSNLGKRASHGCVRLHPANAATLFDLVRNEGMGSTTIVVGNEAYVAALPAPKRIDATATPIETPRVLPAKLKSDGVPGDAVTMPAAPASIPDAKE